MMKFLAGTTIVVFILGFVFSIVLDDKLAQSYCFAWCAGIGARYSFFELIGD